MKIVIYSTPNCANCLALKMTYSSSNVKFEEKLIGKDISIEELQEKAGVQLKQAPVVFVDDLYRGGVVEGMQIMKEYVNVEKQKQEEEIAKIISGINL